MAEEGAFVERERQFGATLGGLLTNFCGAMVTADLNTKNALVERIRQLVAMGNVQVRAETSLIGLDEKMTIDIDVPVVAAADLKSAIVKDATLSVDMTVSSSVETSKSLESKTSGHADFKVGWGPFSVSGGMSAEVSTASHQKRKSDYSSTIHAEVTMGQSEPPEGLMKVIDVVNGMVKRSADLNAKLIELKTKVAIARLEKELAALSPKVEEVEGAPA